ncbi:uncharacterized protein P884DRAFT_107258 [Thermothelomyces heterothallicus CBS 202.75]|uniref:uncharacterized protein n=1 Tax=Thermothelomyces heterothallicus CBS 202.75 TaxID=1149848 RepID=UPI0037425B35
MDTTASDKANEYRPYRLPDGSIAVPYPPGMTEEIRQARIRQYWEDKKLADETAENTKFNKTIKCEDLAGQTAKNRASNKNIKWSDLLEQVEDRREEGRSGAAGKLAVSDTITLIETGNSNLPPAHEDLIAL